MMKVAMRIDRHDSSVSLHVYEAYPYKDALKMRGYRYGMDKSWYTKKQVASSEEAAEWIYSELQHLFQLATANWKPTSDAAIVGFVRVEDRIVKLAEAYGWQFDAPDADGFVKVKKPTSEYLALAEYYREGTPLADYYSKQEVTK